MELLLQVPDTAILNDRLAVALTTNGIQPD
jgi:hypothetical protein